MGARSGRDASAAGTTQSGQGKAMSMNDASNPVTRTGVIGLGAMGLQMARHLVGKGFEVVGFDVDVDAMKRALGHGAKSCLSPAQVGAHAEVVIVMVANDQQVEDAVARSGLLDQLASNSVVCIASSCAPETCRDMETVAAAKNIGVLDCPVVLGQEAANNGTVTCYVGGEERWLARAKPVLMAFSRQVLHSRAGRRGPDREDHQQHAVVGVHGRELRGAHVGEEAWRRHSAPGRGARPRQRRQLVALPLGQEHW
jgi:6-phosphogluconate dehydrogenase (decarboxylating)